MHECGEISGHVTWRLEIRAPRPGRPVTAAEAWLSPNAARKPFIHAPGPAAMIQPPPGVAPAAPRQRPVLVQGQDAASSRTGSAEAEQGEKFQSITYYKSVDNRYVRDVPIDYLGAMREMESLPVATGWYRFIGFKNARNGDNVQFIRIGEDEWYADVPINSGADWDGYYWGAKADTRSVAGMLRLFFEEMPWLGMLPFTMRRYRG